MSVCFHVLGVESEIGCNMTGRMAGQTINDRLLAAKHSLAGQGLAKSVCKATTEEMIGPKKKHLDCKFYKDSAPPVIGRCR